MLLDSSLDDPESWIPWFRDRPTPASIRGNAPVGQLLESVSPIRLRSMATDGTAAAFLYAKVGQEDVLAFPDLLPRSIVRADTRFTSGKSSIGKLPFALRVFHGCQICDSSRKLWIGSLCNRYASYFLSRSWRSQGRVLA